VGRSTKIVHGDPGRAAPRHGHDRRRGARWSSSTAILTLLALAAFAGNGPATAGAATATDRHDGTFRKYSKRFFGPGFDWRVFKAQGIAESNLDMDATSWVGARGIMQLMPSTFREVQSKNPELEAIDDAEMNIAAGIYYDRQLWLRWRGQAGDGDQHRFMFGSYNAGRGTLLRAQEVARSKSLDPTAWPSIRTVAPEVPRWRYGETLGYVFRIESTLEKMDDSGRLRPGQPRP
jgi:membrane-bound lytic murein transglycosylase F